MPQVQRTGTQQNAPQCSWVHIYVDLETKSWDHKSEEISCFPWTPPLKPRPARKRCRTQLVTSNPKTLKNKLPVEVLVVWWVIIIFLQTGMPFWASRHPSNLYAKLSWNVFQRDASLVAPYQLQHNNTHRGLFGVLQHLSWVSSAGALMVNYYGSQPTLVSSLGNMNRITVSRYWFLRLWQSYGIIYHWKPITKLVQSLFDWEDGWGISCDFIWQLKRFFHHTFAVPFRQSGQESCFRWWEEEARHAWTAESGELSGGISHSVDPTLAGWN